MPAEQMARLECLVHQLGGAAKCDPHCDENDSSICFFMMHVVNDVLRYLGLIGDAPTPSLAYKLCAYKQKYLSESLKQLESALL